MKQDRLTSSGFTLRSVAVSIFTILFAGIFIQFTGATDRWAAGLGTEPISPAALIPFIVVALLSGGIYALSRFRILSRAEALCVLYATLIAAPVMSHGFWREMLASAMTAPRNEEFDKLDALSPKVWPHGPNVLAGILAQPNGERTAVHGTVTWREVEVAEGVPSQVVVLANTDASEESSVRVRLAVSEIKRGIPYLLTVLARAHDLGPQARYFCRIYADSNKVPLAEAFTSRQTEKKTYLQRTGFVRVGKYGVIFPKSADTQVEIEFGLLGEGTVELHDAQLMDVDALESAYPGRKLIAQADFDRLPESERAGLIVKPSSMLSLAGIEFMLCGGFPLADWVNPVLVWGAYLLLFAAAMFAVAVIMRRQWVQNERYPLPLAQVPMMLIGDSDDIGRPVPAIWRNRLMWAGFAATLFWCILRICHAFNIAFPDVEVAVPLKPYFPDAGWGETWNDVTFGLSAFLLGIGLFMELNVLMSLVAGFLFFRLQYWFGEAYGFKALQDYPFREYQLLGSFLVYALLALVFTRKYLWRVLKMAVKGERDGVEAMSYRSALILLALSFVAIAGWAKWVDASVPGMLVFFLYMVVVGFVATKLRAECGTPQARFAANIVYLLPIVGGLTFFGPRGMIIVSLAGVIFGYLLTVYNIPGLQLEFLEVGRRVGVRGRHIVYAVLLGLVGGIVIGGWVYLSSMYAIGADNYPLKSAHFQMNGSFAEFTKEMAAATDAMARGDESLTSVSAGPQIWGAVLAGLVTAVVTVLRQLFAGFWFHPIGFILGPSLMAQGAWGSLLVAWLIRFLVLRLGGAVTVREKLLPFATGVFLASLAAYVIAAFVNGHVYFFNYGGPRFGPELF